MKSPKHYYITGSTLIVISIILIAIFLSIPASNKGEITWLNYVSLVVVILGIVLFLYGRFLLKKANFLRLNKTQEEQKKKLEDELLRYKKEEEEDKRKSEYFEDKLKK